MEIKREIPSLLPITSNINIYTLEEFENFEILKNERNFYELIHGKNPFTGRNIMLGGITYKRVLKQLNSKLENSGYPRISKYVNYKEFLGLDKESFIRKQLHKVDESIKERGIIIEKNKRIKEIISKIEGLKWDECIEYDGEFYGVPSVLYGIHRENDCMGQIIGKPYNPNLEFLINYSLICNKCGKVIDKI